MRFIDDISISWTNIPNSMYFPHFMKENTPSQPLQFVFGLTPKTSPNYPLFQGVFRPITIRSIVGILCPVGLFPANIDLWSNYLVSIDMGPIAEA